MFSRYFIERPIFASVCAAFIVIAGCVAIANLPRAQWPNIQPREIGISTFYPGANAETLASTVAAPLEQAIGSVQGLLYTTSTSAGNGHLGITATFDANANIDVALLEVNSRVQSASQLLPAEVQRQGVIVMKRATNPLLVATLYSTDRRLNLSDMQNYAVVNIVDQIARLPGVAGTSMSTSRYYSMRIWLQPDKLARLGLTPLDVIRAVREQNSQYTAGRIGEDPLVDPVDFTFTVNVPGRLSKSEEFEQIVLQTLATGAIVRLKDVARVELGSGRYDVATKLNDQWAVPISVTYQIGANMLETGALVRSRFEELSKTFPPGLAYEISYDSTIHVTNAIHEVTVTLFEALLLVAFVVFVFFGNWRAATIPMLAIPVSIVGAFVVMYLMDFTVNTITLFGMIFSIGIVVDDAIIVVENVQRIMQTQKLDARAATEQTMHEVTRPAIAVVLVLVAVFMPVAFVPGLSGTIYRQFAVTIAGSVALSGIIALTLTPALCAVLLRSPDANDRGAVNYLQSRFAWVTDKYCRVVKFLVGHQWISLSLSFLIVSVLIALSFRVPTSFVPRDDRAIVYVSATLPDAASLSRSQAVVDEITEGLRKHPAVKSVISFAGVDGNSGAYLPGGVNIWVPLKSWEERRGAGMTPSDVIRYIEDYSAQHIRDAHVVASEPAPITGIGSGGGVEGFIQARGASDPHELAQVVQQFLKAVNERDELKAVDSSYRANVPQVRITVDNDKSKLLGVSLDDLYTTLHSNFSAYYINDFSYAGRTWEVQMQSDAPFRARVEDLRNVFVRSSGGQLIPLTSLIRVDETTGPETVERFNGFPAARVFGRVAEGHSSGAAHAAMEEIARKVLPAGYVLSWSGSSYLERIIGKSSNGAFLLSVLMVFLILAAQYERWSLPFAVILTVPFAVFGAFVAIWLRGLNNDVFFQIGLVTLVGLAAKNGVLIVEYAARLQAQGCNASEAAFEAARLRFRPIVMTSAAFMFGVLPLVFATGAGANARHSIGTGVIGGMLAATFIATLFVPVFYIWIANLGRKSTRA